MVERQRARKRSGEAEHEAAPPIVNDVLASEGKPLDPAARAFLEPRFGHSFGQVRVHTDAGAAQSAEALNARAYTVGNDVAFGAGEYAPETSDGMRLIAHELAHVVQQNEATATDSLRVEPVDVPAETEARTAVNSVFVSSDKPILTPVTAIVQREVVQLDPVIISNDSSREKHLQQQSDTMMAQFPAIWQSFCDEWYRSSIDALATIPDLPNPHQDSNFRQALGGNLAWALTSLSLLAKNLPGWGKAVAIGVSLVGSALGSGAAAKDGPPSGKPDIGVILTNSRDQLEQINNHSLFADVAMECINDSRAVSDARIQKEKLWQRFSPDIPFESRRQTMMINAQENIASWLVQYQEQYLQWEQQVLEKAREYELASEASRPFGDPFTAIADTVGIGTPADQYIEMARRYIPFIPSFISR